MSFDVTKPEFREKLMGVFDHTTLRPTDSAASVEITIKEAERVGAYAVCLQPIYATAARKRIDDGVGRLRLKLAVVADFPYGCMTTPSRTELVRNLAVSGDVDEVDAVVQMPYVKSERLDKVEFDLNQLARITHQERLVLKVIVEDAYLTSQERIPLYKIVCKSGADFIKTSTGFADPKQAQIYGNQSIGATVENVALMASVSKELGSEIGIKAAGGIRTLDSALKMLYASQRDLDPKKFRIGASATININEELLNASQK